MEVALTRTQQLNEPKDIDYTKLYVRKVNKTRRLYGNIMYDIAVDNSFMSEMLIYMKQGGQYRLMPYRMQKKAFVTEMCQYSTWKFSFECPLPSGVYSYLGYSPSHKNWPSVIMTSGDYAVETIIEKNLIYIFAVQGICFNYKYIIMIVAMYACYVDINNIE